MIDFKNFKNNENEKGTFFPDKIFLEIINKLKAIMKPCSKLNLSFDAAFF